MPRHTAAKRQISTVWSAKFHEVGSTLRGLILKDPVEQQANDINTNQPKVYDDGKPVMQHIYEVLLVDETKCSEHCNWCAQATPKEGEDPGIRRIYANWAQHKAIQDAIYGVENPELYGLLVLKYVGNDLDKKKPGKAAPKLWKAAYRNPTDEEVARCDEALGVAQNTKSQEDITKEFEGLLKSKETLDDFLNEPSKDKMSFDDLQRINKES